MYPNYLRNLIHFFPYLLILKFHFPLNQYTAKEFIAIWIDNLGTGMSVSKGTYDEATKTLNSTGTMIDPMSGKEVSYRQTVQLIDDEHQLVEMFILEGGKEFKNMMIDLIKI